MSSARQRLALDRGRGAVQTTSWQPERELAPPADAPKATDRGPGRSATAF